MEKKNEHQTSPVASTSKSHKRAPEDHNYSVTDETPKKMWRGDDFMQEYQAITHSLNAIGQTLGNKLTDINETLIKLTNSISKNKCNCSCNKT